jgi:hypothetical protein
LYNFEKIEIAPLTREQTGFIYHVITGEPQEDQITQWLFEGSGGNISYLLELLNEIEISSLDIKELSASKKWPVNEHLHNLVSDRLDQYDKTEGQILAVLAIAWKPVNQEVFHRLPLNTVAN